MEDKTRRDGACDGFQNGRMVHRVHAILTEEVSYAESMKPSSYDAQTVVLRGMVLEQGGMTIQLELSMSSAARHEYRAHVRQHCLLPLLQQLLQPLPRGFWDPLERLFRENRFNADVRWVVGAELGFSCLQALDESRWLDV